MRTEKRGRTSSIRTHLMVMVLVATLPVLGIILYSGIEMRRVALDDAKKQAVSIVQHEALSLQSFVEGTHSMLTILAEVPEVREGRAEPSSGIFRSILAKNPTYTSMDVFDMAGFPIAMAIPTPTPFSISDRKYYRDALNNGEFAVGEFVVSRVTGKPIINYAYPVRSKSGEVTAILQTGYDLDHFRDLLGSQEKVKGVHLVITDHRGTILYRTGSQNDAVGKPDVTSLFRRMSDSPNDLDTFFGTDEKGERGFYAFRRLRFSPGASPGFFLRAGFSEEFIVAEANRLLLRNSLLILAAAGLAILLGASFVRRITRPVQLLVETSGRLASGSYDMALPDATFREIDLLNEHFQAMARAVQDRERELQDRNEELTSVEEELRQQVDEYVRSQDELLNERNKLQVATEILSGRERELQERNEELAAAEEELRQQVDEYIKSQDQLLAEKNKLETILTCMGDGLSIQDLEFRVLFQNEAHKRMAGDASGGLCYEVYEKSNEICDGCPVRLAYADGSIHQVLRVVPRDDGVHYFEISASPLRDGAGNIVAGIELVREITDRKRVEAEVHRLNNQLEQRVYDRTIQLETANRELESFCYSVSHDLRAPLRHMSGFSRILVEDFGDQVPKEAQHYLKRIYEASDRMGDLIDDLLELSRVSRQEMHWETVNLSALAESVCLELRESSPDRQVCCRVADTITVNGDSRLLRLVVQNLLGNAWKYTSKREHAEILFGAEERDGEKVIFVRDNGVGFDMTYVHKLFAPFQRLHGAEFEGTGVGLASVQRIIHRHGGRIWAEGTTGVGATFSFTLGGTSAPSG